MQQAVQDAEAHEFFFKQGGLKVRIGRTRSGGHWAPWKWRRGLRGERHVNLVKTAREENVAKAGAAEDSRSDDRCLCEDRQSRVCQACEGTNARRPAGTEDGRAPPRQAL